MKKEILFSLILMAGCHSRDLRRAATVQAGPSLKKDVFSRFQLTGPDLIQDDSVPWKSDTLFSTSLRCVSDTPLILYKTEGSCICTTMNLATPAIFKKGESVKLSIRYNTHLKGPFSQSVLVFNNTEINPLVISIKGIVR